MITATLASTQLSAISLAGWMLVVFFVSAILSTRTNFRLRFAVPHRFNSDHIQRLRLAGAPFFLHRSIDGSLDPTQKIAASSTRTNMNGSGPTDRDPSLDRRVVRPDESIQRGAIRFSLVIPAQNEEGAIEETISALYTTLMQENIPFEIVVVNDHSSDGTEQKLQQLMAQYPYLRYINNPRPKGFGRAIQSGLDNFTGDAVCIVMADASDDPRDVVQYYRKLQEGYECVFGSRFLHDSRVVDYPAHKLLINRMANAFIKMLFRLPLNDITNAFKAYRRDVIFGVSPIVSPHFNITVELPLKAIIRGYSYSIVPINWYNRKTGVSKLKIKEMGSRYLFIVLIVWLEQKLSLGDYRRIAPPVTSPRIPLPVEVTAAAKSQESSLSQSLARLSVFTVPVVMVSLILWGIWNRTPHVPFWDEWQNIDMVLHYKQGTLSFADFWAFHNEHRIVIPRMLDLGLILLTRWNEQLLMTFDLGLAIAEVILLFAAIRRGLNSTNGMILLVVPVSLLIFSLGQYQNWLWAFQITFICTVLGVACCVYGFVRQPANWPFFLLALFGALLASLSSVGGTMAWIAFLPAAWRASRVKGIVWVVGAAAVLIPYFQGFPHEAPFQFSLGTIGFGLGYLGAPLGYLSISHLQFSVQASVIIGAASIVFALGNLAVYYLLRDYRMKLDAWVGLALFSLAVDGVTTLGRYALFGFSDFLTSRYQIYSALWWVALLVITAKNIMNLGDLARAGKLAWPSGLRLAFVGGNIAFVLFACLALLISNEKSWGSFAGYLYTQRLDEVCVANYQSAPDVCLHGFVWDPSYLRSEAMILDEYHLSVFAGDVGSTRPLIRYDNSNSGDHYATTALVESPNGYSQNYWLGLLYINQHYNTHPLYQCESNTTHLHFVSVDQRCENQIVIGIEGWLYSTNPGDVDTKPLYRCMSGQTYSVWTDTTCQAQRLDMLLGYIVVQHYPWNGDSAG